MDGLRTSASKPSAGMPSGKPPLAIHSARPQQRPSVSADHPKRSHGTRPIAKTGRNGDGAGYAG